MQTETVPAGGSSEDPVIINYLSSARQAQKESNVRGFYSSLSFAIYHMRENACSSKYILGASIDDILALKGKNDMERVVIEDNGSGLMLSLKEK